MVTLDGKNADEDTGGSGGFPPVFPGRFPFPPSPAGALVMTTLRGGLL